MAVGAAIGVGVAVEANVGAVLDEGTVFVRLHAEGHDEAVGEDAGRCGDGGAAGRGSGVRIIEYDHLVAAAGAEERVGGGFLFVAVDGVFEGGHRPHPHASVPRKANEFTEAGGLGDDKLGFEAGWEREREAFLFGCARTGVDGVVADVAGRSGGWGSGGGGGRGGFFLLRGGRGLTRFGVTDLVPRGRAGGGREFFERDVFDLDEGDAAGVNLDPDLAVEGDGRIGLGVVERGDAVDPRPEPRAFGENAVVVPISGANGGVDRGFVEGARDDFVAARFVVEFAPPFVTGVDLIAGHFGVVGHAQAADLHSAIDQAGRGVAGEFELQAEIEVLKRARRCEEVVVRDFFGGGAAGERAVLHAPPFRVAFPAGEGAAVEEGGGSGSSNSGNKNCGAKDRRKSGGEHGEGSRG